MGLSDEWADLERRLPADRDGRMVRRIHPDAPANLYITASPDGRRGLELAVTAKALAEYDPPPPTKAVELTFQNRPNGRSTLSFSLTDPAAGDLFASLCEDVVAAAADTESDEEAIAVWLGRFSRWKRLLQLGSAGLSARRQRGLFAELWAIRDLLAGRVGVIEAVEAWKGPDGTPRDFETHGIGVEVKSSAANEPQIVPVHGERQLDDTELRALYVVHLSLEILRDAGETLPSMVATVRASAEGGPAAGLVEDRLLASGYSHAHERAYARTGYALRRLSVLEVRDEFPRITEATLPDGVGAVRYSLAIDACRDFEVEPDRLTDLLVAHGN